jgi:hypothetical protein
MLVFLHSFGNLCGEVNSKIPNVTNSGLDLTNRTLLYYFDPTNDTALRICVPACPTTDIACICT